MGSLTARIAKFSIFTFTILIILSSVLLLAMRMGYTPSTPYSITSGADNGLSKLNELLQSKGYKTELIMTDPETVVNMKKRVVYAIIGPSLSYDKQAALTILTLLQNGSSILLVDDFGMVNSLLMNIWSILSFGGGGGLMGFDLGEVKVKELYIYLNTSATVLDAGSYWKNPAYIVIRNFNDYYNILEGEVDSVLAQFAASLSIEMLLEFKNGSSKRVITSLPPELGFMLSTPYSWLETDVNSAIEGTAVPNTNEWGGVPFSIAMAFEVPNGGRLMVIGDPDIFTNKVLDIAEKEGFDNQKFILKIFEWLSEPTGTKIIVFDESRKAITPDNPLFGLALTMKIITSFIRYWVIAPAIPIMFIMFFIYYLPRKFRRKVMIFKPSTKKTGTSPYYGRYLWYMYRGGYREAFKILMDNLRRTIKFRLGIPQERWDAILEILAQRRQDLSQDLEKLKNLVDMWAEIVKGKKVKVKPEEYLEIFEFIKKFQAKL